MHPSNGKHRKDPAENGEIVRDADYGGVPGSSRFHGNPVAPPHHSGQLIEKDEFNKIIPESKKAPQVRSLPQFFRRYVLCNVQSI
jgi:hypothetical protein